MSDLCRLDKIAVLRDKKVVAAIVNQIYPDHIELRLVAGDWETVWPADEGKTWVRGWEGPAYNVLMTVLTLSEQLEQPDDDWSAYT